MKDNEQRIEEKDRQLLNLEIVFGTLIFVLFISLMLIVSIVEIKEWIRLAIIMPNFIIFIIAVYFMLKIEQLAGYYECKKCKQKYVPTFRSILWSMHFCRTRRMKCPKCGMKSWQKKVIK